MNPSAREQPQDPITRLWEAVRAALRQAGDPSPNQIEQLSLELDLPRLPASTVESWFASWSVVPRKWEQLDTLIKCLCAERDRDWKALWRDADQARGRRRPGEDDGALSAETSSVSDAPHTPTRPSQLPWALAAAALIVAGLIGVGLLVFRPSNTGQPWPVTSSSAPHSPPTPSLTCAYVIREPAAVRHSPDSASRLIKYKYTNERVVIARRPRSPTDWWPIRLPADDPGIGWMRRDQLTAPATCVTPLPGEPH